MYSIAKKIHTNIQTHTSQIINASFAQSQKERKLYSGFKYMYTLLCNLVWADCNEPELLRGAERTLQMNNVQCKSDSYIGVYSAWYYNITMYKY